MKKLKNILTSFLFCSAIMALGACGNGHEHGSGSGGDAKAHGASKEFTSAYVCPMHCEGSGSDQPGQCPACGMDYVAQSEHTKDGHAH
jgi:hypothetical protein